MRAALLSLLLAGSLSATPIGGVVIANPGSSWRYVLNGGEATGRIRFNSSFFVLGGIMGQIEWESGLTPVTVIHATSSPLGPVSFPAIAGYEVLLVAGPWVSGPGGRNQDGEVYFSIAQTPEPATIGLLGLGLGLIVARRRKGRQKPNA